MSLIEWNPFRERIRELGDFWGRFPSRFFDEAFGPKVDVYQTEDEVILKAEIPGVSKENLSVIVNENSIRLSGQNKRDEVFKEENVYRRERYFGSFSREISLPAEIKPEEARAECRDGILTVTAPKVEPSRARGRKLEIQ